MSESVDKDADTVAAAAINAVPALAGTEAGAQVQAEVAAGLKNGHEAGRIDIHKAAHDVEHGHHRESEDRGR